MQPAGPDLARRWLAVLTLVPEHERESVVRAVEHRIHTEFVSDDSDAVGGGTDAG